MNLNVIESISRVRICNSHLGPSNEVLAGLSWWRDDQKVNESRRREFLSTIGEVEGVILGKADKKVNSTTY